MSCLFCEDGCGRVVDTDDEPESFIRLRRNNSVEERCLCAWCRDDAWESEEVLPEEYRVSSASDSAGLYAWQKSAWKRQYRAGLFRQ